MQARFAWLRFNIHRVILGIKMTNDLQKLETTVETFCRYIETLPRVATSRQAWGPREVLAHLVFWHASYVAQIEAMLAGAPFELPQGRFSDLNAQAVAVLRGASIDQLVSRLRAANARLCALYAEHDPNTIVLEIKQGSKLWRLTELVPAVEAHIRNHQRQLGRSRRESSHRRSRTSNLGAKKMRKGRSQ